MKILIPAPEHVDSFAHNVAHTLRAMGHEVHSAPLTLSRVLPRLRTTAYDLWARSSANARTVEERWAVSAAAERKPDMVLAVTQQLSEHTLYRLGELGVRWRVAWWGDAPSNMKRLGLLTPGWDAMFLKDRVAVDKLRRVGRNAHFLHEAMNPAWHRPVATRRTDDIVVIGSWYAYRQALATRLLDEGVSIRAYGARPPFWRLPGMHRISVGGYITGDDKSRAFGEGLACLNSMDFAEGNSLNCRAFEIAGAGGLQLIEHRPAIEDCFEIGRELLAFNTLEELLAHIEWARRSPAEANAVREAGARRALAEHTYAHRLTTILATLEGRA